MIRASKLAWGPACSVGSRSSARLPSAPTCRGIRVGGIATRWTTGSARPSAPPSWPAKNCSACWSFSIRMSPHSRRTTSSFSWRSPANWGPPPPPPPRPAPPSRRPRPRRGRPPPPPIQQVGQVIGRRLEMQHLLEEVVHQVGEVLGYPLVEILLVEGDQLVQRARLGTSEQEPGRTPLHTG